MEKNRKLKIQELENRELTDKSIIEIFYLPNGYMGRICTNKKWLDEHSKIVNYLQNRFSDSESIKETLYRIKNSLEEKPKCSICGKKIKFNGREFPLTCSASCAAKMCSDKKIQTCREKYGSDYMFQSDHFKEVCIEHFGVDNPAKSQEIMDKTIQTCKDKYGNNYFYERMVNSTQKLYGVDNPMQVQDVIEQRKQNFLDKYGVENPSQLEEIKHKIKETYKETCQKKWGVDNYYQTNEFKEQIKPLKKSIEQKKYHTHKINNSFKTSQIELDFENYLSENFPNDYISQYHSTLYPFNCDFYIISLDLYVELQGTWTHGGHPFDHNSRQDLEVLEVWKSKNTNYYNNAIETWTRRDVNKRNMAKENNLKYLEIFSTNLDECISIFKNYVITL